MGLQPCWALWLQRQQFLQEAMLNTPAHRTAPPEGPLSVPGLKYCARLRPVPDGIRCLNSSLQRVTSGQHRDTTEQEKPDAEATGCSHKKCQDRGASVAASGWGGAGMGLLWGGREVSELAVITVP